MKDELTYEQRRELIKLKSECDIKLIRASVRPVLAFMFSIAWLAFLFMVYMDGGGWSDIPLPFTAVVFAWDGWYFTDRTVTKIAGALKNWNIPEK